MIAGTLRRFHREREGGPLSVRHLVERCRKLDDGDTRGRRGEDGLAGGVERNHRGDCSLGINELLEFLGRHQSRQQSARGGVPNLDRIQRHDQRLAAWTIRRAEYPGVVGPLQDGIDIGVQQLDGVVEESDCIAGCVSRRADGSYLGSVGKRRGWSRTPRRSCRAAPDWWRR